MIAEKNVLVFPLWLKVGNTQLSPGFRALLRQSLSVAHWAVASSKLIGWTLGTVSRVEPLRE